MPANLIDQYYDLMWMRDRVESDLVHHRVHHDFCHLHQCQDHAAMLSKRDRLSTEIRAMLTKLAEQ